MISVIQSKNGKKANVKRKNRLQTTENQTKINQTQITRHSIYHNTFIIYLTFLANKLKSNHVNMIKSSLAKNEMSILCN